MSDAPELGELWLEVSNGDVFVMQYDPKGPEEKVEARWMEGVGWYVPITKGFYKICHPPEPEAVHG